MALVWLNIAILQYPPGKLIGYYSVPTWEKNWEGTQIVWKMQPPVELKTQSHLCPNEGSMGKYSPEYQLSSRVAMSQLKEPRVMKVDMRSEY